MNPNSLQLLCNNKCLQIIKDSVKNYQYNKIKYPHSHESHHERLKLMQDFLVVNIPRSILIEFAAQCYYHFDSNFTIIFLPSLLTNGSLKLHGLNSVNTLKWISQSDECQEWIKDLTCLSILEPDSNYFPLLKLLKLTPKLKKFEITSLTSDDVITVLATCCQDLEVFDAQDDSGCTVTDVGLGFLSQCKQLKTVLFSSVSDEFDLKEDQFNFSSKGLGMLILSLPKLKHIQCPKYLLRDALKYVYQFQEFKNHSLVLENLQLNYNHIPASTISILPYLCPKLNTLSLMVPASNDKPTIAKALHRLSNLRKLHWLEDDHPNFQYQPFGLVSFGHRLEYLSLQTFTISESDVCALDSCCTKLKTLILNFSIFNEVEYGRSHQTPLSILPSLEVLEITGKVPDTLFCLLNTKCRNLKTAVYNNLILFEKYETVRHYRSIVVQCLKHIYKRIVDDGGWQQLEVLSLSDKVVDWDHFQKLTSNLTKLKSVNCNCRCNIRIGKISCSNLIYCSYYNDIPSPSANMFTIDY